MPTPLSYAEPLSTSASGRGEALLRTVARLYPLHRCITGEGVRKTLRILGETIPLETHEVATGTPVLDWTVPEEWAVGEAFIALPDGTRIVDLADSPLHVVQYSTTVQARMTLADLRPHLHTLPDQPSRTPYRTSYWNETWGFCLSQETLDRLAEGGEDQVLDVCIDSRFSQGSLTYGECVLPGETDEEVLFSAHACHPALANDNASALAVAAALADALQHRPRRRYTYRFLFAPGTIGAITWLAQHRAHVEKVRHGLVLANLGDRGGFTYKKTRRGTFETPRRIDRAVALALGGEQLDVRPFEPFGYDERQFNSPGFDLPVGRLTRTPHGEYPEYHTSADDLELMSAESLDGSLEALLKIVEILEGDARYQSLAPYGEPQLGRYGLYRTLGGAPATPEGEAAILWTLNMADGTHHLVDIAEQSGLPFAAVRHAADRLLAADLLAEV